MHIDHNECIDGDLGKLGELLTHKHDRFVKLRKQKLPVVSDLALLLKVTLNVRRPDDLRGIQHDLTGVADDPVVAILRCIVDQTLFEDVADGCDHLTFDISHPELDVTVLGVHTLNEVDLFSLDGHHGHHGVIVTEFEISDSFEHFSQMGSHSAHLFRLREDFKKIVIREEVESSKVRSLLLQVLLETFLDKLKVLVGVKETLFVAFLTTVVKDAWVLLALVHDVAPLNIDSLESFRLRRQLLHDVG